MCVGGGSVGDGGWCDVCARVCGACACVHVLRLAHDADSAAKYA